MQIGFFFTMTGTGPKTTMLAFLLNLNVEQDFFPHIGCDLIQSKVIMDEVLVSLKPVAELPYLGCQDVSPDLFRDLERLG